MLWQIACISIIIIINIIYAKLDCHIIIIATKTKYMSGLNATPDIIIIDLSSIEALI